MKLCANTSHAWHSSFGIDSNRFAICKHSYIYIYIRAAVPKSLARVTSVIAFTFPHCPLSRLSFVRFVRADRRIRVRYFERTHVERGVSGWQKRIKRIQTVLKWVRRIPLYIYIYYNCITTEVEEQAGNRWIRRQKYKLLKLLFFYYDVNKNMSSTLLNYNNNIFGSMRKGDRFILNLLDLEVVFRKLSVKKFRLDKLNCSRFCHDDHI